MNVKIQRYMLGLLLFILVVGSAVPSFAAESRQAVPYRRGRKGAEGRWSQAIQGF